MSDPLITDWMQAWSTVITTTLAIFGIPFMLYQIRQIKVQLKISTLTNILSLEADITLRKEKLDDINHKIEKLNINGELDDNKKIVYEKYQNAAIENWLNSVDKLCFCIKHNYLKEKDRKIEYRDYIIAIVKDFEGKFGESSKYTSIIDMNKKWLRE